MPVDLTPIQADRHFHARCSDGDSHRMVMPFGNMTDDSV